MDSRPVGEETSLRGYSGKDNINWAAGFIFLVGLQVDRPVDERTSRF